MTQMFDKSARVDPDKPGQKARVLMAFVMVVTVHGPRSNESHDLIWEDHGNDLVTKQVQNGLNGLGEKFLLGILFIKRLEIF